MIKARHIASFTMIPDNAFRCTETFTRFTRTVRPLIITKAGCKGKIKFKDPLDIDKLTILHGGTMNLRWQVAPFSGFP